VQLSQSRAAIPRRDCPLASCSEYVPSADRGSKWHFNMRYYAKHQSLYSAIAASQRRFCRLREVLACFTVHGHTLCLEWQRLFSGTTNHTQYGKREADEHKILAVVLSFVHMLQRWDWDFPHLASSSPTNSNKQGVSSCNDTCMVHITE